MVSYGAQANRASRRRARGIVLQVASSYDDMPIILRYNTRTRHLGRSNSEMMTMRILVARTSSSCGLSDMRKRSELCQLGHVGCPLKAQYADEHPIFAASGSGRDQRHRR